MKVGVLQLVFLLSVSAFVFVNPLFAIGPTRVIYDQFGNATIRNADGTSSRIVKDQLGNATIYNSNGGLSRMVKDQLGNTTIRNADGSSSRIVKDQLGNATIYNSDGSLSRMVKDQLGNATIRNADGSSSRIVGDQLGNATIYNHGGGSIYRPSSSYSSPSYGSSSYGSSSYSSPSYGSSSYGSSSYSSPSYGSSSYGSSSYSSPSYGSPSHIPGYGLISERSAEDEAAEAVMKLVAKLALEAGLQSAEPKCFTADRSYADESCSHGSSTRQSRKRRYPFRVFLFVIFLGILCVLGSDEDEDMPLYKKAFSVPAKAINWTFGCRCEMTRDSQGELVSVKMPMSVVIPLAVTYVVCALPVVISLAVTVDPITWGACLIPMLIPMSLYYGKISARSWVVFFCVLVIIAMVLLRAWTEGECGELFAWLCYDGIALFSYSLIAMLNLPQSNEWFAAKEEMSSVRLRKMKKTFELKIHRIFSSSVFVFLRKWYMWIAAVIITICLVVIFRDLFSPLPSARELRKDEVKNGVVLTPRGWSPARQDDLNQEENEQQEKPVKEPNDQGTR